MPYFPTVDEQKYYCPRCQAWYTRGNLSCCVAHAPGTCCHKYEEQTTPPRTRRLKEEVMESTVLTERDKIASELYEWIKSTRGIDFQDRFGLFHACADYIQAHYKRREPRPWAAM